MMTANQRVSVRMKILFSVCMVLGPFALAEVGLRITGFELSEPDPEAPIRFRGIGVLQGHATSYVRADPDLFWTLREDANLRLSSGETFERSTEQGLRGWSLASPKPDGVRRVAVIGDSCAYGFGVELGVTFAFRLERLLRSAGIDAEIVNGAVPGYSSHQFVTRFRRDVLPLEPDVLIVYAGQWNDFTPAVGLPDHERSAAPATAAPAVAPRRWGGVRVLQAASRAVEKLRSGRERARMERIDRTFRQEGRLLSGPRVPIERFRANLTELADEARRSGVDVYFLPGPVRSDTEERFGDVLRYRKVVRDLAHEKSIPLLDVVAEMREGGDDVTFRDWVHPSPRGHGVLARVVFERLCEEGALGLSAPDVQTIPSARVVRRVFEGPEWRAQLDGAAWRPGSVDADVPSGPPVLVATAPSSAVFMAPGGHRRCSARSRVRWTGPGSVSYSVRIASGGEPAVTVAEGELGGDAREGRWVATFENRERGDLRVELVVEASDDPATPLPEDAGFEWSALDWSELP